MEIDVVSRDIALVAAAVRKLGNGRTIVNEMAGQIRKAVPPIRKAVRAHELEVLPHRGGLNEWVARAGVRAAVRRAARTAGVSFVQGRNSRGGRSDLKRIDAGRVRAPAWGNRKAWHLQAVPAGAFTNAVTTEGAQEFRAAVVVAVDEAARKVGL